MDDRHSRGLSRASRLVISLLAVAGAVAAIALLTANSEGVWGATERPVAKKGDFILKLSADKAVYSLGETPKFTATIENRTQNAVYVVPALDGSSAGMRYPLVQFTVTRPKNATPLQGIGRCGNTNNISPADFLRVPPKKSVDILGWAGIHSQTFSDEGDYVVTVTYSTKAENKRWYGFMGPLKNKATINRLLKGVPSMTLSSNTVSIRFGSGHPLTTQQQEEFVQ